MENIDVEYNYETSDDNKIFKEVETNLVDLQNFKVIVDDVGIDFIEHASTSKFETKIENLIAYIKKHSKHPIYFETMDPSLLD